MRADGSEPHVSSSHTLIRCFSSIVRSLRRVDGWVSAVQKNAGGNTLRLVIVYSKTRTLKVRILGGGGVASNIYIYMYISISLSLSPSLSFSLSPSLRALLGLGQAVTQKGIDLANYRCFKDGAPFGSHASRLRGKRVGLGCSAKPFRS